MTFLIILLFINTIVSFIGAINHFRKQHSLSLLSVSSCINVTLYIILFIVA